MQNTKQENGEVRPSGPTRSAWLQAAGDAPTPGGQVRRMAVSIGPEQGTVGPQQVKEAAGRRSGAWGTISCWCAALPLTRTSRKIHPLRQLTVLPVRMNPDLAMGDELLKDRRGQPVHGLWRARRPASAPLDDGRITIEIPGVDVYNLHGRDCARPQPTTSPAGSSTRTMTASRSLRRRLRTSADEAV